jgi:hypothetical protein
MTAPLAPVPRDDITTVQGKTGLLTSPWRAWFEQLRVYLSATSAGGGGIPPNTRKISTTAPLAGGGTLGADITLSLAANGVSNGFLAQMAANTIKGNNTGATTTAQDLTASQVTALLAIFSSTLQGVVPPSGGGTATLLRADATFAAGVTGSFTVSGTGILGSTGTGTVASGVTGVFLNGGNSAEQLWVNSTAGANQKIWDVYVGNNTINYRCVNDLNSVGTNWMTVTRSAALATGVVFSTPVGVSGNTAPAQVTGWGTPTNNSVIANFSGSVGAETLTQVAAVVAQIIKDLKAFGLYGA